MTEVVGTYNVTRAPGRPGHASPGDTVTITNTAEPTKVSVTVLEGGTPRRAWDRLDFEFRSDLECYIRQVADWDGEAHPHIMLLEVDQVSAARLISCRVVSLEDLSGGGHSHPVSGAHYTGSWHGSD